MLRTCCQWGVAGYRRESTVVTAEESALLASMLERKRGTAGCERSWILKRRSGEGCLGGLGVRIGAEANAGLGGTGDIGSWKYRLVVGGIEEINVYRSCGSGDG